MLPKLTYSWTWLKFLFTLATFVTKQFTPTISIHTIFKIDYAASFFTIHIWLNGKILGLISLIENAHQKQGTWPGPVADTYLKNKKENEISHKSTMFSVTQGTGSHVKTKGCITWAQNFFSEETRRKILIEGSWSTYNDNIKAEVGSNS
jgi:hypothetical protein